MAIGKLLITGVFVPFSRKRNRKSFFLFPLFEKSGAKTFQSACAYAQAMFFCSHRAGFAALFTRDTGHGA
ncbi:MAG: hypothetical protein ACI4JC_00215, partial [Faecalibacterium sp.]